MICPWSVHLERMNILKMTKEAYSPQLLECVALKVVVLMWSNFISQPALMSDESSLLLANIAVCHSVVTEDGFSSVCMDWCRVDLSGSPGCVDEK